MLFGMLQRRFSADIDTLVILLQVFLSQTKNITYKDSLGINVSSIYLRLEELGFNASSLSDEERFYKYLEWVYGKRTLSEFVRHYRNFDPTQTVYYYLKSNICIEEMHRYFTNETRFKNVDRATYLKVHELFIQFWTPSYMPEEISNGYIPVIKNCMKEYFQNAKSAEIARIVNNSGLNLEEVREGQSFSYAQFMTDPVRLDVKVTPVDELDFREVSRKIADVSTKGKCIAFLHGKGVSGSFYDVFSFFKYRKLKEYYEVLTEALPLDLRSTVILEDENIRNFNYVKKGGSWVTEPISSKEYLCELKLKIRLAGLEEMCRIINGQYGQLKLSEMKQRVDLAETQMMANSKDLKITTECGDLPSEAVWEIYSQGFAAAWDLVKSLERQKINIFNVPSDGFSVEPLVGRFSRLTDYIKYMESNKNLVLQAPNTGGISLEDSLRLIEEEYRRDTSEIRYSKLDKAKSVPLNDLLEYFYIGGESRLHKNNGTLNPLCTFELPLVDKLLALCKKDLSAIFGGEDSPMDKFGAVLITYLEKSGFLVYDIDYKVSCGRSDFKVNLYGDSVYRHYYDTWDYMSDVEKLLGVLRIYYFLFIFRGTLNSLVKKVKEAKYPSRLYNVYMTNERFLEFLTEENLSIANQALDRWYHDVKFYFVTTNFSRLRAMQLFSKIWEAIHHPEVSSTFWTDVRDLAKVFDEMRQENRTLLQIPTKPKMTVDVKIVSNALLEINSMYQIEEFFNPGIDVYTGLKLLPTGEYMVEDIGDFLVYEHFSGKSVLLNKDTKETLIRQNGGV